MAAEKCRFPSRNCRKTALKRQRKLKNGDFFKNMRGSLMNVVSFTRKFLNKWLFVLLRL